MENPIVLFDGVCNLCNWMVRFIIARDPHKRFRFASLQSKTGQEFLQKHGFPTTNFNTTILIMGDNFYIKSSAALRIARMLNKGWPLFFVFIIVPSFIRDYVYGIISKNRYKWFGQKEVCYAPRPELKERFLE